jgi:hypothetical protein
MAALFLDLGPFSRYVITRVNEQIAQIDAGEWRSQLDNTTSPAQQAPAAALQAKVTAG